MKVRRVPHPQEKAIHDKFGELMHAGRVAHQVSQKALGEAVGLSEASICEIEAGKRRVFLVDALLIASILKLPLRSLRLKKEKP